MRTDNMSPAKPAADTLPTLSFPDQPAWDEWLHAHHAQSAGVWLKLAKTGAGDTPAATLAYAQALDIALCYGWIDGQKKALDARYWLQRFTPRRPRSAWSRINRDKATALINAGKMQPAGLREVRAAQRDGRWDAAYEGQRNAQVPPDLQAALDANPKAKAFFEGLDSKNRYAILYRLQAAKKPETRAKNVEKFVGMMERGERVYG